MLDLVKSVFVVTLATGWLAACAQDAVDYRPQTWFHLIGGNVSRAGLTADLEAVKAAGLPTITPMVVCNTDEYPTFNTFVGKDVTNDDVVIELAK